jgi:hypothetical protein
VSLLQAVFRAPVDVALPGEGKLEVAVEIVAPERPGRSRWCACRAAR